MPAVAAGQPTLQAAPMGPFEIIVSIGDQRVSLYGSTGLIARSRVSTGMRRHPTPLGIFSVIQKQRWHRSNIYSAAPMPFMQRITWSGIALHAGALPGHPASHGCIRLSRDFAVLLWRLTRRGTRVIIARREVAPADIVDPHLFALPPKPNGTDLSAGAGGRSDDERSAVKTVAAAGKGLPTQDVKPTDEARAPPAPSPRAVPRRKAAISVLISGKDSRLYVRRGFVPVFDAPVTIRDPHRRLGTHVFTAMAPADAGAGMRWTVGSIPEAVDRPGEQTQGEAGRRVHGRTETPAAVPLETPPEAAETLDRIGIPKEALDRIADLLVPGSSLIISDHGMSEETEADTDFIVMTR